MRSRRTKLIGIALGVLLLLVIGMVFLRFGVFGGTPQLEVRLVGKAITREGGSIWFGVTNIGSGTAFTYPNGQIQMEQDTNRLPVGATTPKQKLDRGEGQIVQVNLSREERFSLTNKWRFSCFYAQDGLRARIYRWQWGPNGPGAKVNWLVPQFLKGIPLTVIGVSVWQEPAAEWKLGEETPGPASK